MEELIKQMTLVYELMARPEFAKAIARMYKNIYDELILAGFNNEQALDLLASMKLGGK